MPDGQGYRKECLAAIFSRCPLHPPAYNRPCAQEPEAVSFTAGLRTPTAGLIGLLEKPKGQRRAWMQIPLGKPGSKQVLACGQLKEGRSHLLISE